MLIYFLQKRVIALNLEILGQLSRLRLIQQCLVNYRALLEPKLTWLRKYSPKCILKVTDELLTFGLLAVLLLRWLVVKDLGLSWILTTRYAISVGLMFVLLMRYIFGQESEICVKRDLESE